MDLALGIAPWLIFGIVLTYCSIYQKEDRHVTVEGVYTQKFRYGPAPHTEQIMSENENTGVAPIVTDEKHVQALNLVVAYFEALGATEIKARLPGYEPPPVLTGTMEAHRPDFVCRQANTAKTPIIMEVVLDPKKLNTSRATLFSSARQMWGSDLGFVVSSDYENPEFRLRYRLNTLDITPQKVLVI